MVSFKINKYKLISIKPIYYKQIKQFDKLHDIVNC